MADRKYILDRLIKDNNIKRYCELGVFRGDTVLYLLEQNPGLMVVAVDEWVNRPDYDDVANKENMGQLKSEFYTKTYKYSGRLVIFNQKTSEAHKLISPHYFDMVFIDAEHTFEAVQDDINTWLYKIKYGGILCGHDIAMEGVRRAVNELGEYSVEGNVWIHKLSAFTQVTIEL